ncbi:hypothetical protein N8I77_006009 [Diaporthe amygdali]|uniref:Uncharacterized protein n=1 Tax=Phomopsis amygdali TaxID=1214568 RepID=A0AAD9W3Z7_PHOAM|nr:hypothetical protein N8I77_006009 [Diaporthe amygdali]
MFSCCFSGRDYEDDAQHEQLRPEPAKIPSEEMSAAKPLTGRRKPSNAAQMGPPTSQPVMSSNYRNNDKVKPSDYLYFGEGSSGHHARRTVSNSTSQQGRPSNGPNYTKAGSGNPSGRDNSGYLATGLNNNTQMGYSNLTYGGSLQYNFAGTQPIGVGT